MRKALVVGFVVMGFVISIVQCGAHLHARVDAGDHPPSRAHDHSKHRHSNDPAPSTPDPCCLVIRVPDSVQSHDSLILDRRYVGDTNRLMDKTDLSRSGLLIAVSNAFPSPDDGFRELLRLHQSYGPQLYPIHGPPGLLGGAAERSI